MSLWECLCRHLKGERYNRTIGWSYNQGRKIIEIQQQRLDFEEECMAWTEMKYEHQRQNLSPEENQTRKNDRRRSIKMERQALKEQLSELDNLEQIYMYCGLQRFIHK